MRGWLAGVAIAMGACGPDPLQGADLDPLCGEDGAFRVLALEADEMPSSYGGILRVDDRIYYVVGEAVSEADAPFGEGLFAADLPHPPTGRVVSTGSCGESPSVVAEGIESVRPLDRWPHAVLGYAEGTHDLMVLDPMGEAPPRLLLADAPNRIETEVGWLTIVSDAPDALDGRLVLQPFPDPIDAPLPAEVEVPTGGSVHAEFVFDLGSELLVLNLAGEVRSIDLMTVQSTVLASGASSLVLADGARFLVMTQPSADDPQGPQRVAALDRSTNAITELAQAQPDFELFPFGTDSGVVIPLIPAGQRVISFPSLAAVDLGDDPQLSYAIADGVFLGRQGDTSVVYVVATGLTIPAPQFAIGYEPDAFFAAELTGELQWSSYRFSGPLWRVPYSGAPREQLARRVGHAFLRRPDGGLLTVVDVDTDFLGTLIAVEPDTLEEQPIDERVFGIDVDLATPGVFEDGVIAYGVRDGDRSGVWLAKPTPLGD